MNLSTVVTCPNCKMRVLPKADGTCPSCQAIIPQKEKRLISKSIEPIENSEASTDLKQEPSSMTKIKTTAKVVDKRRVSHGSVPTRLKEETKRKPALVPELSKPRARSPKKTWLIKVEGIGLLLILVVTVFIAIRKATNHDEAIANSPTATNPPAVAEPPTATNPPPFAGPLTAGEWVAITDFGKLVFTVDATGTKITKMDYEFSNWECGTVPSSVRAVKSVTIESEWTITDGYFSIGNFIDNNSSQYMTFSGSYDAAIQKFSGKWEETSYGTNCFGTWESTSSPVSPILIPPTISSQVSAIEKIRTDLELPELPLDFIEKTVMMTSPTGVLVVDIYQDSNGRKYSVHPETNQVVEIDARTLLPNTETLSMEVLKSKAMKYIKATIPDFEHLQSSWQYDEVETEDSYIFAWYDMTPGWLNHPFAQIGFHKSGLLFAYYNTLLLNK